MLKGICARAIVPVTIAVTGFVVVCCFMLYSFIKADMTEESVRHAGGLADTIIKSTRYTMLKSDWDTLHNIVDNVGTQDEVVHVRIFNQDGLVMFSEKHQEENKYLESDESICMAAVPNAELGSERRMRQYTKEECGAVLAITTPIMNEASCSTAACHFHSPSEKILGFVDIGISQQPLQQTLSLLQWRMVVFSVMVLILSVGGVSALLLKNVFTPIQLLLEYTDKAVQEDSQEPVPEIDGELGGLARNCGRMVSQRDAAIEMLTHPGSPGGKADCI